MLPTQEEDRQVCAFFHFLIKGFCEWRQGRFVKIRCLRQGVCVNSLFLAALKEQTDKVTHSHVVCDTLLPVYLHYTPIRMVEKYKILFFSKSQSSHLLQFLVMWTDMDGAFGFFSSCFLMWIGSVLKKKRWMTLIVALNNQLQQLYQNSW